MTLYLLDTNVFDSVVKNSISLDNLVGRRIFVTHIQADELSNTTDEQHRSKILAAFKTIESEKIPTEGAVWGVSRWDESKFDDEVGSYDKLITAITNCDKKSKSKKPTSQSRDALLALTAIKQNLILVTNDQCLKEVVLASGGQAISLNEFLPSRS